MQLFTLVDNFISNQSLTYIRWLTVFFLIPEILFLLTHRNSVIKHWRIFPAISIVAIALSWSWDYFGINDGVWFFPKSTVGVWILGLPLEEYLFFIFVAILGAFTVLFFKKAH